MVSTDLILPFLYLRVLAPYSPSYPLFCILFPLASTNLWTGLVLPSYLSFLKKKTFLFVYDSYNGEFHCDISKYMNYILNWFIPSIILLSTVYLSPLMVISTEGGIHSDNPN
jgi:hypothetical protein